MCLKIDLHWILVATVLLYLSIIIKKPFGNNELDLILKLYNHCMEKEAILHYLTNVKSIYQKEGFLTKALFGSYSRDEETEDSDVDILVEATPDFANRYGFELYKRIQEIQAEISKALGSLFFTKFALFKMLLMFKSCSV